MGKGKKKFINKGDGEHFFLMHRSKTDGAHAEAGEAPSEFVLVNSKQTNALRPSTGQADKLLKSGKDHFDALGFRNDGYDYSQHLKEMGGGQFIGVDGRSQALPAPRIVELPASARPSEKELDRALQSITIDPDLMDPDLKAALFEEDDGMGGFEELQDDFITQCLTEPEVMDFDYDAHIANLIAMSERKNDAVGARGWDQGEKASMQRKGVRFEGDEDEDDDESGEFESYCSGDERLRGEGGAALDDLFDKTLEEYGSDDMGDLADEAEDIQGVLDANEEGTLLDAALNEFIEERADLELTDGVKLSEIERTAKGARFLPGEEAAEVDEDTLAAQVAELKMESSVLLPPEEPEDPAAVAEVMKSVTYLAEEREEEQWDCETILTTYSTLDNHPSLIKDGNPNKSRKKRDRRPPKQAANQTSASASSSITEVATSNPNTKIVLAGKLGLPKVVVAGPARKTVIAPIAEDEDDSEEEEGSDSGSEHSLEPRKQKDVPGSRKKGETAEERKARKQKVKDERRVNRATKKQVKQAFSSEYQQQVSTAGRKQDIDHVSVFKYT